MTCRVTLPDQPAVHALLGVGERVTEVDQQSQHDRTGGQRPGVPVASADYVERYLPNGFTAEAAQAPSLAWNRNDTLQDTLLRRVFRRNIARSVHYVPSAEGFGAAVRAGLGWGMYPEQLAAPALVDGSFVRISGAHLDVPLFWQCWKINSPMVKTITDRVWSAAAGLRPPRK